MAVSPIKMPQLGESVTEGTVDKWLKQEGDFVKRDEPIVEDVTDKVKAEIPSPFEGKLVKSAVSEGETVCVGAVIAQIETAPGAGGAAGAGGGADPSRRQARGAREAQRDAQVDRRAHGAKPRHLAPCMDPAGGRCHQPRPLPRRGEGQLPGATRYRPHLPPIRRPD